MSLEHEQTANHREVALFYHPAYLEHDPGEHPESPARLRAILAALERRGIPQSSLLLPEPVDLAILEEVHDPRYIEALAKVAQKGGGYWDLDTYISPGSYDAAVLAAGASTAAVDAVMQGSRSAFALVRPPGHHALYKSAMGFCLFNNIAIAAHHAVKRHGLKRVLIVDWDVHHGNGTQDYFYDRSDVLFFSSHQYPFYPGTGALHERGSGLGLGYNVNVPLHASTGDYGYRKVFAEIVVPLARRYKPQLILISAGYDAHMGDPLGGMAVSTSGFSELARTVRQLADEIPECEGRVAAILEGGYNVEALAASVIATIGALGAPRDSSGTLEDVISPSVSPSPGRRESSVDDIIAQVRQLHKLGT